MDMYCAIPSSHKYNVSKNISSFLEKKKKTDRGVYPIGCMKNNICSAVWSNGSLSTVQKILLSMNVSVWSPQTFK